MNTKKTLLGCTLFVFVFFIFAFFLNDNWFSIDDLGHILNSKITSWKDFLRVFSEDARYARTYNYQFPAPNLISGFYRPLQHVFFSILHPLFGLNPYVFFILQVVFHAANATLIFLISTYFLPLSLSFFGGLFCSFFPGLGWMLWLCTFQHTLTLFFLLLSILVYLHWYFVSKKNVFFYTSGIFFFLSLLARESHAFHAFWGFGALFLFSIKTTFWKKCVDALGKSWIFFVVTGVYWGLRLNAFGYQSLLRTINNVIIEYPFLKKIFISTPKAITSVATSSPALQTITQASQSITPHIHTPSLLTKLLDKFYSWAQVILNLPTSNKVILVTTVIFLSLFIMIAYRNNKKSLFFLIAGIPLWIWPGILVFPATRYIHSAYPLFIFIFLYGVYILWKQRNVFAYLLCSTIMLMLSYSLLHHFSNTINVLKSSNALRRERYAEIFTQYHVPRNVHFIAISTPEEADLDRCFQTAGNNFDLTLAHVTISKFAEKGAFGCQGNYTVTGIKSTVKPIENGIRLISQDPHCAWFFHNYQPVRWSEKDRAYVRHHEPYTANIWYNFSMGKFFIHKIVDGLYVTDVSFVFDSKWITSTTKFLYWDTLDGKYRILPDPEWLKKIK